MSNPIGSKTGRGKAWFDPRFAIGMLLVAASVFGVVALIGAADSSTIVLAARSTLVAGQRATAGDFAPTSIRADSLGALYLRRSDIPTAGLIMTRSVSEGELAPKSAVAVVASDETTSVVVPLATTLPGSLRAGSRVDLWSAAAADSTTFAAPAVLVPTAVVVRVLENKEIVASGSATSVELMVPRDAVAGVLDAIANGAALSVVAVDLPLGH